MLGGVFISYRREDAAGFAGRIYDRLTRRLDPKSVFLDVDTIQPGLDFFDVLSEKLRVCDALIAVIGKNWNSSADKDNRRRLDDPDDFVRIEIEAALQRGIRVIPVLVDGATMPSREDLPDSLQKLRRRQAIEISHNRFDSDVERLTHALYLIEEELGQREMVEAERARKEGEGQEVAEAADEVRQVAEAEAARRANDERRVRETEVSLARRRSARTWRRPLLLLGLSAGAAALIAAWFLLTPFVRLRGNMQAIGPSVSPQQTQATSQQSSSDQNQSVSPNRPPVTVPQEQTLTPTEENQMGDRYLHGRGVEQDYAKAMEWYRKAADHGSADAQFNIGFLYQSGWGVAEDVEQAKVWYQKAADQGDAFAKAALQRLQTHAATTAPAPTAAVPQPAKPEACRAEPLAPVTSRAPNVLTAAEQCGLKPKDVFQECSDCPEMVVVPAGSFTMGSPENEPGRADNEGPRHDVRIAKPFAVGKFHVTVDEFKAFVRSTNYDVGSSCYGWSSKGYQPETGRTVLNPGFAQTGSHPAVCISWDDAQAYVKWLAAKTGAPYRLLTEAEWEYAARGQTQPGTYPRYFFGDSEADFCKYGNGGDQTILRNHMWYPWKPFPCNDGYAYTSPAGSFEPNAFGLFDMHGNAYQLVEDCYHGSYFGAPSDGGAWTGGACDKRVGRGASWQTDTRTNRAANCGDTTPSHRDNLTRFRVARTLAP